MPVTVNIGQLAAGGIFIQILVNHLLRILRVLPDTQHKNKCPLIAVNDGGGRLNRTARVQPRTGFTRQSALFHGRRITL
ncbi:hypothetical protein D3C81_2132430 [compost metagenome]